LSLIEALKNKKFSLFIFKYLFLNLTWSELVLSALKNFFEFNLKNICFDFKLPSPHSKEK
jgi:hypothetical protein